MRILIVLLLLFSPLSHAQIYRCGNSYSDAPCAAGVQPMDASPAVQAEPATASEAIHLCQSHSGARYWTRKACSEKQATLVQTVQVPVDLSWNEQLQLAKTARLQAEQKAKEKAKAVKARPESGKTAARPDKRRQRCQQLGEQLRKLDARARAGGTARSMQRLRTRRNELESERFKLQCPV